jgi:hypothetical protein
MNYVSVYASAREEGVGYDGSLSNSRIWREQWEWRRNPVWKLLLDCSMD